MMPTSSGTRMSALSSSTGVRQSGKQCLSGSLEYTQDDEASTSGSEDDDEAMEASGMDAKIAAVLRATADAKESSRRQKEAMAQLRFRVRHRGSRCAK